jgi:hypothetical protein
MLTDTLTLQALHLNNNLLGESSDLSPGVLNNGVNNSCRELINHDHHDDDADDDDDDDDDDDQDDQDGQDDRELMLR